MSQPITTRDVLRRARQILTPPERWGKGRLRDGEALCAIGGVIGAGNELGATARLVDSAICRLARGTARVSRTNKIAAYNDDPATTHEDILRLFDAAIGGK